MAHLAFPYPEREDSGDSVMELPNRLSPLSLGSLKLSSTPSPPSSPTSSCAPTPSSTSAASMPPSPTRLVSKALISPWEVTLGAGVWRGGGKTWMQVGRPRSSVKLKSIKGNFPIIIITAILYQALTMYIHSAWIHTLLTVCRDFSLAFLPQI